MGLSGAIGRLRSARSHKYTPVDTHSGLEHEEGGISDPRRAPRRMSRDRGIFRVSMIVAGILLLFFLILVLPTAFSHEAKDVAISHLWGQYSPYFSVPSELSPAVPADCTVTFVQVLSRHGARDPTSRMTAVYNATLAEIRRTATSYGKGYEFLRDFEYTLGTDQLTRFGIDQMLDQGRAVASQYHDLAKAEIPFIRASGQDRVIDSAVHWLSGFRSSSHPGSTTPGDERDGIVVIPEHNGSNNTLDHGLCNAFESGPDATLGDESRDAWADIFIAPIVTRLSTNLPGAKITRDEAVFLMDLCPFTTVADPLGVPSAFCHLFTADEWQSYDYYQSLGKYYGYGAGNPLGPTQGVGFVNELVARLTGTPVRDETSSNSSLNASPETFPLDRGFYADFSHDNTMLSIFAALGLYNGTEELPTGRRVAPDDAGGFSASWAVPFAGRMIVEKMVCGEEPGEEELVRVLVNDRVMPLEWCGADELGRCELGDFVEGLSFARSGGSWGECFL
ncbi:related to 3-phytase A precursor [Cephalotrichum gorgonifer]|uniref:Phytase A n=1 Tax=Cephalotrichum gorgonifer TaxID=2041049 RepID=A0AAE8MS78_9PEZI|nr:related to 3-phytase A precursor [Cephalotrichum gorgonifer]